MAILSEQSVHLGNVGVNDPPEVRRVGGDMERSVRPPGHKYLLAGDSLSFYAHVPLFLYCTPAPVHVQVAPADALQPPRVRLQPQEAEDPRDLRHVAAQHSLE